MSAARARLESLVRLFDERVYRSATIAFAVLLFVLSLTTLNRYGETVDEGYAAHRAVKYLAYIDHVFSGRNLVSFEDYLKAIGQRGNFAHFRYGGLWPITHVLIENFIVSRLGVPRFPGKHVAYILLFYGSLLCFVLMAARLMGWRGAFLSTCFLLLYPQLFHHAHNNPKDVPMMCFAVISAYGFLIAAEENRIGFAVFSAWFMALAISTRLDAAVFVIVFFFGWIDYLRRERQGFPFRKIFEGRWQVALCFAVLLPILVYAMWPSIWFTTDGILQASKHFSGRFHMHEGMYLGRFYNSKSFPWHYMPVNLLVATPVVLVLLLLIGGVGLTLSRPYPTPADRWKILIWGMFLGPIIPRLLPGATQYNNIRHILPSIPALALIAGSGAERLARWLDDRSLKVVSLLGQAAVVGWLIVESASFFPYGSAYFNEAARMIWPGKVHTQFESEYWSASYLEGIEWINEHASAGAKVCVPFDGHTTGRYTRRSDLKWVCAPDSDYLLLYGKFFHMIERPKYSDKWGTSGLALEHVISRRGIEILRIYMRRPGEILATPAS
jgi:4-amino-4-deoxy-L-arabinose transferase-like glycosyltransferase